ncbi:MAG: hypothetical protein HQ561_13495 [Desulfobacteraceae bacterium]|nr:hypothetical protein [Desulfobacteraceae bacterium]
MAVLEQLRQWRKRLGNKTCKELKVRLDEDSVERLKRLKTKIRTFDDNDLVASALKSLEDKVDRISKEQVVRKSEP